jgi:hypothetical protein
MKGKPVRPTAVFTRNHQVHLDDALVVCSQDPTRPVTFRAATVWATAERTVSTTGPVPLYIAAIGHDRGVEFVAELIEIQTRPSKGDSTTKRLLGYSTNSTRHEGLWEQYNKTVRTLYVMRGLRRLAKPFPLSALTRALDERPLSDRFQYSYALVRPVVV